MELNYLQNQTTQPLRQHKVFNNWNVVTLGWYAACKASEIKKNQVKSVTVCGQKIAIFRDDHGALAAMDGYCPHMGVDLGIGKVVDGHLRCFFHHWKFDKEGKCVDIPAQEEIPKKACIQTYAVEEKYGMIWIFPDKETKEPLLEIPGLEGYEVSYKIGKPFPRKCHYHITMINGIDPQHLKTVHDIHIDMDLQIDETDRNFIDIELSGAVDRGSLAGKMFNMVFGDRYAYSMKYAHGCIGGLTLMKNLKFFGRTGVIPELHMMFAYGHRGAGKTTVQPIYLTKKRKGPIGFLVSSFLLWMTKRGFYFLQGEDGEVYDNIRFNTDCLLPIDSPVAKYIGYINRLTPSIWSKSIAPQVGE